MIYEELRGSPGVVKICEIFISERARKEYGDIEELCISINKEGLIEPLCIMETEEKEGFRYKLLAGGRRLEALKQLKWEEAAANIYPFIEDERVQRIIELKENTVRLDLSWQERAILTRKIHETMLDLEGKRYQGQGKEEGGWTIQDTADFIGTNRSTVRQDIILSVAGEENPSLLTNKNRSTALKKVESGIHKRLVEERTRRLASATVKSTLDQLRDSLCGAYNIGECVEAMKQMHSESVDHVMIDPPYGIDLKFKGINSEEQMELLYGGPSIDKEAYLSLIRDVFEQSHRIMKSNGWLFCWFAMDPWYDPFMQLLKVSGFAPSLPLIWVKNWGNTRVPSQRLANKYEPCIYARKGKITIATRGKGNVFLYNTLHSQQEQKIHPTEKPIDLLTDIYTTFIFPGTTIFVPFLGSGNDILAAANVKCTAFGYDLSEEYKEQFKARVYGGEPGQYTSYKGV